MLKLTDKGKQLYEATKHFSSREIDSIKIVEAGIRDSNIYKIQKPRFTSLKTLKAKGLIEEE